MLFIVECLLAFLILFVLPLWGLYRFINRDPEKDKLKTVYAELVDHWEYQGYNGPGITLRSMKYTKPLKQKRYVGVFRTEDGEELTLAGDVSFDTVPLGVYGILKYKQGWFCDFSEDVE